MAVTPPLCGKHIRLVCASESDAEFTMKIREDPDLTRFIPALHNTLENQKKWIEAQRTKENDVFYVIKGSSMESKGPISCYGFEDLHCVLGRYISYGNALENVEAAVLLLDYLFGSRDIEYVVLTPDEKNEAIISFWKKFGAVFSERIQRDGWTEAQYHLHKADYLERRKKIVRLIGME